SALVAAGGTLAPGASAGELSVGAVELQGGALLEIEIGGVAAGTDHDLLTVDGALALGGDLVVSLLDSGGEVFTPYASDVFSVVSAGSLVGAFSNVADGGRIETLGGEGSFAVSYSETSDLVVLSDFLTSGLIGDFNSDGVVDAADYTVWRDTEGETGMTPYSGADADGDGQVTETDHAAWKANFGATAPAEPAAVPEPTTLLLVAAALAACSPARGRGGNALSE
ncbi:unnamed protein product, partial [Ectocarpus sp. 4 AP-2014]